MIDMPIPVRAIDSDAHGQARPGLSEAALMVLAQEVVTRLAHWSPTSGASPSTIIQRPVRLAVTPNVDALCDALIGIDPLVAKKMILKAHAQGASHEELCLYHIAEAARQLGARWDVDEISFRDMALAAGRMLHLLRDLRDLAPPFEPRGERCALFATVPGERHVLGVTMAADLFREEGWDVDLRLGLGEVELAELVRSGGYPIVGLSAASAERLRALARVIVEVRLVAPKILIFVSGYISRLEPNIAVRVGADGNAWDMDRCKSELEGLYDVVPKVVMSTSQRR